VRHSEYNASKTDPVHFLQIWIIPSARGLPAGYEQKTFSAEEKRVRLRLVASPDGAEGSVLLRQDVRLFATLLERGQSVTHTVAGDRKGWLHVVTGGLEVNGVPLREGDGLAITGEETLSLGGKDTGEALLFDMTG
jgi:quercetin 2,3-dioxygenase